MDLGVSTSWNYPRHGALAPAVREIADLGFSAVELRAPAAGAEERTTGGASGGPLVVADRAAIRSARCGSCERVHRAAHRR